MKAPCRNCFHYYICHSGGDMHCLACDCQSYVSVAEHRARLEAELKAAIKAAKEVNNG